MKVKDCSSKRQAFYFPVLCGLLVVLILLPGTLSWAETSAKPQREIHFKSGSYTLFGYYFPPKKGFKGKGIVLCPGSSNKGCSNILFPEICKRFAKLGYACLTFDFRGYGRSEGPVTVTSFKQLDFTEDAISAVTELKRLIPSVKGVVMMGHSMGGGVAVSAGVRDRRVGAIVSISPGRRVEELYMGKNAKYGMEGILQRMHEDMTKKISISLPLLRDVNLPIVIDSYRDFVFLKPILFIEGTYEDPKDIAFLTRYVRDITVLNRKDHILLPTNHWIGTANGTRVVFPVAIHILVVTVDAWLRNDEARLVDILRRVKHSKRLPMGTVRAK